MALQYERFLAENILSFTEHIVHNTNLIEVASNTPLKNPVKFVSTCEYRIVPAVLKRRWSVGFPTMPGRSGDSAVPNRLQVTGVSGV